MLEQCIAAVTQAAGRKLSKAEIDGIEERMLSSMQTLARKDPAAWRSMSKDQRYVEAAKLARSRYGEDVMAAQARTIRDMQTRTNQTRLADSFKPGLNGRLAALRQRLTFGNRHAGDISLDQKIRAVHNDFSRELDGGAMKGKFWGLIQNPAEQRSIVKAIFGEPTGNPEHDQLGQQVRDVLERARQTANDAGVQIHHLENWNLPQPWAWEKVGADRAQFVKDMLAEIDTNSYVRRDGTPMTAEEIRKTVEAAAETLGTNGANKRAEGQGGYGGSVGSSRNAPRQLHFKNADGYLRMMEKYGASNNVMSLLDQHFNGLARDIATARTFGRDADRFVPQLIERTFAADAQSGLSEKQLKKLESLKKQTLKEYQALRSPGHPGDLPLWAQVSNTIRGVVGSTLLGGSTLAAIPDGAMAAAYGHEIGLTKRALLGNMAEGVKPTKENLAYIRRLGITAQTMQDGTHRFGSGELSNQFTRFLNHGVHVLSLLRMFDRTQTHGFSASLMDLLGGHVAKHDFAELAPADQKYLADRGVSSDHYATWRQAELEGGPNGNHTMLTPDSIYAIPDEKLAPIAEHRVAAVSEKFREAAQKLKDRNAAEVEWVGKRAQKLDDLKARASATVHELRSKGTVKEAHAKGEAEALAEMLDAKVAVAEITQKLDRTLAAEKSADRIRGIMADVAQAERTAKGTFDSGNTANVHESGKPENAAKAALNSGMRLGEKLGATRARALRRLRDAEAEVARVRREGKGRADEVAQKFAAQIDKHTDALQQFTDESQQRRDMRNQWIAEYEKAGGNLVAEDTRRLRSEAAQHLLATVLSETQIGARGASGNSIRDNVALHVTPDNAGTVMGQMARWMLFLKQTPLGIFRTHMIDVPGGMNDWKSAWAYRARFMAMSASLGALALTAKSIVLGQDPDNLLTKEGLQKVALASGGFGMYGDFFFGDKADHQNNGLVKLLGPGATAIDDAIKLYGATGDELTGEGKNYGAKALQFARNYAMPFTRLWYAKAAFNHMVYQQQMEKLVPGYNARVRQRMARKGQTAWWEPGEMAPQRAPNLGAAVGTPGNP